MKLSKKVPQAILAVGLFAAPVFAQTPPVNNPRPSNPTETAAPTDHSGLVGLWGLLGLLGFLGLMRTPSERFNKTKGVYEPTEPRPIEPHPTRL